MGIDTRRMTGRIDGDFVVFLIGMRVNRWWKPWQWVRVAASMPRMVKELEQKPELGYLGSESWFGRTTVMLQYWRSMDHLMSYAKQRDAAHLPAWRSYNKLIGNTGDVGVWHETYRVRPGDYESVYVNMMPFGLGRAGHLLEAKGKRDSAKDRLAELAPAAAAAAAAAAEEATHADAAPAEAAPAS